MLNNALLYYFNFKQNTTAKTNFQLFWNRTALYCVLRLTGYYCVQQLYYGQLHTIKNLNWVDKFFTYEKNE